MMTIYPALEVSMDLCTIEMFETKKEMLAARNTCANMLLFLGDDKAGVMSDYSNMFVLEELIDNQWEEIHD